MLVNPAHIFLLLAIVTACFFLLLAVAFVLQRRRRKPRPVDRTHRCPCGYALDQLDTIRCPECGRVSGFDATPADLGLTAEQLRLAKAKRDARKAGETV